MTHENSQTNGEAIPPVSLVDEIISSITQEDVAAVYGAYAGSVQGLDKVPFHVRASHIRFIERIENAGPQEYLVMYRLKSALYAFAPKTDVANTKVGQPHWTVPETLRSASFFVDADVPETAESAFSAFADVANAYKDRSDKYNHRFEGTSSYYSGFGEWHEGLDFKVVYERIATIIGRDDEAFERVFSGEVDRLPEDARIRLVTAARLDSGHEKDTFRSLTFASSYFRSIYDLGASDAIWLAGKVQSRYAQGIQAVTWRSELEGYVVQQVTDGLTDSELSLAYGYITLADMPEVTRQTNIDYLDAMRTICLRAIEEASELNPGLTQLHSFLEQARTPLRGHDYQQYGKSVVPDVTIIAAAAAVTGPINEYRREQGDEPLARLKPDSNRDLPEALNRLMEAVQVAMMRQGNLDVLDDRRLNIFNELFAMFDRLGQRREAYITAKRAVNVGNAALARSVVTQVNIGTVPEIRGQGQQYWSRWRPGWGQLS